MRNTAAGTQSAPGRRPRSFGQARPTVSRAGLRPVMGRLAAGLAALLAGAGLAQAEPAWRELKGEVRGVAYAEPGGVPSFVFGCTDGAGAFIQAALPEGGRPKAGRSTSLNLSIDSRRFFPRGTIAIDEAAEGGPRAAVVAPVKADDPLVAALATGRVLKVGKGRTTLTLPLDAAREPIAQALRSCGAAAAPAPQAATSSAPAAPAPAATAAPAAEPKPTRAGALPPATDIAAAIFVDPAEGKRVAGKLKITAVDLNGDGAPEALITVADPAWCGVGGCTWFVVEFSGKPRVMGQFTGTALVPGKETHDGWRDLSLKGEGGTEPMYYRDGAYH